MSKGTVKSRLSRRRARAYATGCADHWLRREAEDGCGASYEAARQRAVPGVQGGIETERALETAERREEPGVEEVMTEDSTDYALAV